VNTILAGHLARARELLAGPSPPGLFDLASRVGALEELLATICDDVESERQVRIPEPQIRQLLTDSVSNLAVESCPAGGQIRQPDSTPGSKIIPACPECTAAARSSVTWTGGMPGGGDSWRCTACGSAWETEEA